MTGAPVLEADRLGRSFDLRGKAALHEVSFAVARGEVFGVVGPSGSGKSTLSRLLVGLDRPTHGSVRFEGADLATLSARRLRRLRTSFQLVFQDPLTTADPRWTARQTIEEAIAVKEGRSDPVRLAEVLRLAHLDPEMLDRRPHALSGGERQRVALARALAVDPDLVILDEAVSALDVCTRRAAIDNLLQWRKRRRATVIVISHDLRLVAAIADRALLLEGGRVAAIGPARSVLARLRPPDREGEQPEVP